MGKTDEVHFVQGQRSKAIQVALDLVRKKGVPAEFTICKDIPGKHSGGEDCFCDPMVIRVYPEEL